MGVYTAGQLATLMATFTVEAILSAELVEGTAYTSITVAPLPLAVPAGGVITLGQTPNYSVQITCPSGASSGATTVNVNSFTPTQPFTPGATLTYLADPAVVKLNYYGGKGATLTQLTYSNSDSGTGVILRASAGVYYILFDTTGKPGTWSGAWECPAGSAGQCYQQWNFGVQVAPV